MILTRPIIIRLLVLGLVTAILEVSFFSQLRVLGSSPDFALLVVMSLGLLGGSLSGAVAGFGIGFVIDCLLLQTLGATSLSLMAVGYVAGRYREGFGRPTLGATVRPSPDLAPPPWACAGSMAPAETPDVRDVPSIQEE